MRDWMVWYLGASPVVKVNDTVKVTECVLNLRVDDGFSPGIKEIAGYEMNQANHAFLRMSWFVAKGAMAVMDIPFSGCGGGVHVFAAAAREHLFFSSSVFLQYSMIYW